MRPALVIAGVAWFVVGWFVLKYQVDFLVDARAYLNVDLISPYQGVLGDKGVFAYSPPIAALFAGLHAIPAPVFLAGWFAMNVGIVAWLLHGQRAVGLMLAMPISDALLTGQLELLMLVAILSSQPVAWAFPILAKSTTGVGLLWYAARRDWHSLAAALGVLVAICVGSIFATPGWWLDWLAFLQQTTSGGGQLLLVRIPVAAALVVWAARTNRGWLLPVAMILALPVIYIHSLAILLGVVPLRRHMSVRPERFPNLLEPARSVPVTPGP